MKLQGSESIELYDREYPYAIFQHWLEGDEHSYLTICLNKEEYEKVLLNFGKYKIDEWECLFYNGEE